MDRADLLERLARTRSRGQVKALGADADADPALRSALEQLGQERGVDGVADLPGKTLVRRVLSRGDQAQVRRNPIRRDEAFTCVFCGASVQPGGAMVRDHCPRCLRSRHVDNVPGDRAADCGGVLQPVGFDRLGDTVVVLYRCDACGHDHRCRAHPDDDVPPSLSVADLPGAGSNKAHGRARTLPRRVLAFVRGQRLWQPGDDVLVAVSGGLDSMVLLELLWRTREAHGGRLRVLTLDHGLRPESAQEVRDVLTRCETLGVPAQAQRLDVAPGPDLYRRARELRRAALLAAAGAGAGGAGGAGSARIATAHHRDDQAETVLQRLMAGSGAAGLRAMQARDGAWCRPLLDEPRAVLAAWAQEEGLSWVDDPSNATSERGRLRVLLDGLGELREGATRGLARSARLLAREDAFVEAALDAVWAGLCAGGEGLDLAALRALDPALQLRALRRLSGGRGRGDQVERFLVGDVGEGWRLELGGGCEVLVRGGRVLVTGLRYETSVDDPGEPRVQGVHGTYDMLVVAEGEDFR